MFGGLGAPELIIVLLVVLLLFGSTKLPKLARSIGQASQEFKKGVSEGGKDDADGDAKAESKSAEAKKGEPKPAGPANEQVVMTRAELDALLAEREAQARKDVPPQS